MQPLLFKAVQSDPTHLSKKAAARVAALYDGSGRYLCPCCGSTLRTFRPNFTPFIPNVKCPKCFSFERHRLLWLYLRDRTNFFSAPLRVLHFAPELCFRKHFEEAPNLQYVTMDIAQSAMIHADITNLPFKTNCFDVILCLHVLEHVSNDTEAMQELLRVLKPDGWAIMMVPIDASRDVTFEDPSITSPEERERAFWQSDHVRLYGRDFSSKLANAGFSVTAERYGKELPADIVHRYGLVDDEEIYVLHKAT